MHMHKFFPLGKRKISRKLKNNFFREKKPAGKSSNYRFIRIILFLLIFRIPISPTCYYPIETVVF